MRVSLPMKMTVSLSSLVALAGCQSAAMVDPSPADVEDSAPAESSETQEATEEAPSDQSSTDDATMSGGMMAAAYADGAYEATGGYQSPNGPETVVVSVTLTDGVISAVELTPQPSNSTTDRYQEMFAGGIGEEVVGKSLDDADVSRVAGSSLTSGGFAKALESIRQDAKVS
jgi:uncharacterized protein with FMN-binding domain